MAEGSSLTPVGAGTFLQLLRGVGSRLDIWAQVDEGRSVLLVLTRNHLL